MHFRSDVFIVEGGPFYHCPPFGEPALSLCGPYSYCPRGTHCYHRDHLNDICCRLQGKFQIMFISDLKKG